MLAELDLLILAQAATAHDTIVTLTMPAQRTAFDYASGILQILVLLVGLLLLGVSVALALTVRSVIKSLEETVQKLQGQLTPLIQQVTRTGEDAREIVQTVSREIDKFAKASGEMSSTLIELSETASERLDEVNALLDVIQDEVQNTALSTAATIRGLRVGASALSDTFSLSSLSNSEEEPWPEEDSDDDFDDEFDEETYEEERPRTRSGRRRPKA